MKHWSIDSKVGKGKILYSILQHPGICQYDISKSNLYRLNCNIQELQEHGYIEIVPCSGKNKKRLYLTEKGIDTISGICDNASMKGKEL